ncbi:tripartite motif-containing protein 43-like [Sarcophilus harrisii]|uniref:tripartite motif-containing protein 43-like n=1 Tax=Sarcophilus harrisii TaxID=9305 RepID=UPI001301EF78|nr:tripartite motif-containing protein 43-like [Sarcophilus harrisii]
MADEVQEDLCINCLKEDINLIRVECGHNICMSCFRNKTAPPLCCTICWEFSQLRTRVDMAMYPEGEGMCEIHREDLKLFCERKKTLLCVTCSKSGSHDNHIHWPIAVAALCYRKKILWQIEVLNRKLKIVQQILLNEKEQPLVWAVAWNFVGKENKKFNELNQRLKEIEAIQEHHIMQKKKEWETMMSNQNRCLTSVITELEEKLHKPDVAVLQDMAEILESNCIRLNLQPFITRLDVSYITEVIEFLKVFERHRLSERCHFYDLSEEKKRAIRIVPGFSALSIASFTQEILRLCLSPNGRNLSPGGSFKTVPAFNVCPLSDPERMDS